MQNSIFSSITNLLLGLTIILGLITTKSTYAQSNKIKKKSSISDKKSDDSEDEMNQEEDEIDEDEREEKRLWSKKYFHNETPNFLHNQLSFGLGVTVGSASGGDQTTEFDPLGFHMFALYKLPDSLNPFSLIDDDGLIVGFYYKTFTAIETPEKTLSADAFNVGYQNILASFGYVAPFMGFDMIAMISLGTMRITKSSQEGLLPDETKSSGSFELQGLARYPISERIYTHLGLGSQSGNITRIGLELGFSGMF